MEKKSCDEEGALPYFDLGTGHPLLLLRKQSENTECGEGEEFLSMRDHTKFYLLRMLVNTYLEQMDGKQTIGNKSKNELTSEILKLSSIMMR